MKFITGLIFVLSLLVFGSVFISPEVFPYAGLLPFLVPLALITNAFLFFMLALAWRRLAFFPLLCLAIGYKFILITFQFHPKNEEAEGLKVLSYNAHLFNYKNPPTGDEDPTVFSWLNEQPADIKVIQEFYQDFTIESKDALKFLSKDDSSLKSHLRLKSIPSKCGRYGVMIRIIHFTMGFKLQGCQA